MIKSIFKNAMIGTAMAGSVFSVVEPEITGAAISSARDAFDQGYKETVNGTSSRVGEMSDNSDAQLSTILRDIFVATGEKYAQFQNGLNNPQQLSELLQERSLLSPDQDSDDFVSNIESEFRMAGLYDEGLISNIERYFENKGLYQDNSISSLLVPKP